MKQGNAREVVVITGASAGLGRATARLFAEQGANLGLIARGEDRLEAVKREVEALGGKAVAVSADVAGAEQVDSAAGKIEEILGPIDIWINNAMTTVFSPLEKISPEDYRRVTEVTYLGQVYGARAALARMRKRDRGTIIHVGSALAYRSIPLQSAYSGAKHAVKGFFEALRCELISEGSRIQVSLVNMPALNTPQFDWCKNHMPKRARPVAPVYQPEVGARALCWVAHHPRRELNVGVSSPLTIWGNRLAPELMDRYLAHTAIDGQQTSEPVDPDAPDNLWESVNGDRGAHGRFPSESHPFSPQFLLARSRNVVGLTGAAVLLGAVTSLGMRKMRERPQGRG